MAAVFAGGRRPVDDSAAAPGAIVVDTSLRMAIAPRGVASPENARFAVKVGLRGTFLTERVDLARPEWQVVEVRLDLLLDVQVAGYYRGIRFAEVTLSGNFEGQVYIDDLRLVTASPPPVPTAVVEEQTDRRPQAFDLLQSFPNPFNSATTIRFEVPSAGQVELAVYNLAGQRAATLASGWRAAGSHEVRWDGRDDAGQTLATGVYLYRLRTGDGTGTRRLLVLR